MCGDNLCDSEYIVTSFTRHKLYLRSWANFKKEKNKQKQNNRKKLRKNCVSPFFLGAWAGSFMTGFVACCCVVCSALIASGVCCL